MSDHQSQDAQIQRAIANSKTPKPGISVDKAILSYAEKALESPSHSRLAGLPAALVWPLSVAAGLTICIGLFYQMAQITKPEPSFIQSGNNEFASLEYVEPRRIKAPPAQPAGPMMIGDSGESHYGEEEFRSQRAAQEAGVADANRQSLEQFAATEGPGSKNLDHDPFAWIRESKARSDSKENATLQTEETSTAVEQPQPQQLAYFDRNSLAPLRKAKARGDRQGFVLAYRELKKQQPDAVLPPDLAQWAQRRNLLIEDERYEY